MRLTFDPTLAWYFARVRFRRVLLAEAMINFGKGVSRHHDPTGRLPRPGRAAV